MFDRVDNNQKEIVGFLRRIGCTVVVTSSVKGFVDIVVGLKGVNYLFEIKSKSGKLTEKQKELHDSWRGSIHIVRSIEDCAEVLGLSKILGFEVKK